MSLDRAAADPLTPTALQAHLKTAVFGHRVFSYPSIGSTNDRALELATAGEPEGSLVLAEEQTGGRGRRERTWASPPGLGIYASLILRPHVEAPKAPLFTIAAAVSVATALRAAGVEARIKWPNDILVGARKIAGILGETRGSEPEIRDLVIGIGINVHHEAGDFPDDLARRATSLRIETGTGRRRAEILAAVLEEFERRYTRLLRGAPDELLRDWGMMSALPAGGRIAVDGPAGRCEGELVGVDADGALMLREAGGGTTRVPFGEIVETLWP
jgi:BirA family biotin operon repressor/biotin-[acetyl-CoA-carboxylase] ligase